MSIRLRWQREIGLIDRTHRHWIPQKPQCEGGGRGFVSVGLTEVHPAVMLLVFGAAASFGVMIIEIIFKMFMMKMEKSHKLALEIKILKKQFK